MTDSILPPKIPPTANTSKADGNISIPNTPAPILHISKTDNKTARSTEHGNRAAPLRVRIKGISLILLCSVLSTFQGGIFRYLNNIPTGQVMMMVGVHCVCFYGIVVSHRNISLIRFTHMKLVFLRAVIGASASVCKIWSVQNMRIGDATALTFTAPLFAGVLARLFLGEKYTLAHIFATAAGLVGIVLIAKPTFIFPAPGLQDTPAWYSLVPLSAALLLGSAYVVQRKIGQVGRY